MPTTIYTSALTGFEATPIAVEADMTKNLPGIVIVGMGSKSVDESRERIKSALMNSGLNFPRRRVTINLAPADLPKDGSSYDLAMTCAILGLSNQLSIESLQNIAFYGELGLDGTIRPIRGIIAHLSALQKAGIKTAIIPKSNLKQASLVEGIRLLPCSSLKELYQHFQNIITIKPEHIPVQATTLSQTNVDFKYISDQPRAKRALEIAASGHHNILMTGPPGTGKTMLARALPSILPPPTLQEIRQMTQIASLADADRDKLVTSRPFRSPHHSASQVSLVGGGQKLLPGEVSRAHGGVLFLDELPEFSRHALEALRQPLEDNIISISRALGTVEYPAKCIFVATKNPCPCGFNNDPSKECICTPQQLERYTKKLSGPLIDRIDMIIRVDRIDHTSLLRESEAETSKSILTRVQAATDRQIKRNNKANAYLSAHEIKKYIVMSPKSKDFINQASSKLQLSARSYLKIIKVAQTIADLDKKSIIEHTHIAEALQYRIDNHSL